MRPKYSIIIPTRNAVKYLPACINSILACNYDNYELIISNNCSTDETQTYLDSLSDSHIRILKTDRALNIGDSWNYAISQAKGEWLFGIGSDDAVLPFFFEILDKLVAICNKENLKVIKTKRVYYFYPQIVDTSYDISHDAHISFEMHKTNYEIKSIEPLIKEVLYGEESIFYDIPQMYTTSVFNREIIDKAINLSDNGRIIQGTATQDAFLGLLAYIFEDRYLYIDLPISWVGTSPSCHGLNDYVQKEKLTDTDYKEMTYNLYKYTGSISLLQATAIISFEKHYKNFKIPKDLENLNIKLMFSKLYSKVKHDKVKNEIFLEMIKTHNFSISDFKDNNDFENNDDALINKSEEKQKLKFLNPIKAIKYKIWKKIHDYRTCEIYLFMTISDKKYLSIKEVNELIFKKNKKKINKIISNI